jgi:hypothetical protein
MSYDDELHLEVFESGYREGIAMHQAREKHAATPEAFRDGFAIGKTAAASEFDADIQAAKRASLDAGRRLGLRHAAELQVLPGGLDSDEACVWLAVVTHLGSDRAAVHAHVREMKPGLSIGAIDKVRRELQARELILPARSGHRTVYVAVSP